MLEEFEVTKYRGLENLKLSSLRRVNLVTGPNGVGKTSLSEALWLYHGRYNPVIIWSIHIQRRPFFGGLSPLANLGQRPINLEGSKMGNSTASNSILKKFFRLYPSARKGPKRAQAPKHMALFHPIHGTHLSSNRSLTR